MKNKLKRKNKGSTSLVTLGVVSLVSYFAYTEINARFFQNSYLDNIQEKGQLDVLVRNAPTIFYEGKSGKEGLEYDLIRDFSEYINVKPNFIVKSDTVGIIQSFTAGEGDIAAAGLTQTEARASHFSFGPQYQSVEQQVVCRRDSVVPKSPSEIKNISLWVTASSSYVDTLIKLKTTHTELVWNETDAYDTEQLLQQVWSKKIDCTIADSNIVAINRRYYPELVIAFNASKPEPHAWILPKGATELQAALNQWFTFYKESGELDATLERNFGYIDSFDYVDTQRFKKQIRKRLPRYKKYFIKAADKHGLPWTLIAAQAYQESHWRARAKSPTGVRGIMMLTLPTAREMGVKWRLNPKTSIFGGTKYLRKLMRKLPAEIKEPDRTWFALAAYNVGLGHVKDAMKLAKTQGKDPRKWNDLADVLPLLTQRKYFEKLRYGYARGHEPVLYVKRIRNFRDILEREVLIESQKSEVASADKSDDKSAEKKANKSTEKNLEANAVRNENKKS